LRCPPDHHECGGLGERGGADLKVLLRPGLTVEREQGTRKFVRLRREELDARFPGLLASVLQA
jgi:hypothetical protein